MVLETPVKLYMTAGFFEKKKKCFIGKFGHQLFLNFVSNENLCYLLYSCPDPIFEENLVLEIWAKKPLTSQIVGFLNQMYL